eukprot:scaffold36534_cov73-Isochrysis_galbana.AAC.1
MAWKVGGRATPRAQQPLVERLDVGGRRPGWRLAECATVGWKVGGRATPRAQQPLVERLEVGGRRPGWRLAECATMGWKVGAHARNNLWSSDSRLVEGDPAGVRDDGLKGWRPRAQQPLVEQLEVGGRRPGWRLAECATMGWKVGGPATPRAQQPLVEQLGVGGRRPGWRLAECATMG